MLIKEEIRLSNIEQLKELPAGFDFISMGSEGCIHKLPSHDELKYLLEQEKFSKLVTPFVPQAHLNNFLDYLEKTPSLNTKKLDLIVNDYGILYELNQRKLYEKFNFWAGRMLEYSFSEIPYIEDVIKGDETQNYNDSQKQTKDIYIDSITQSSFYNKYKLNFFQKMHIYGVEGNGISSQFNSLAQVKKLGFEVSIHSPYIMTSVARACQTSKYFKKMPPDCRTCCDKMITLKMKEVLPVAARDEFPVDNKAIDIVPYLYVFGNISTFSKDINIEKIDFASTVILDFRSQIPGVFKE